MEEEDFSLVVGRKQRAALAAQGEGQWSLGSKELITQMSLKEASSNGTWEVR